MENKINTLLPFGGLNVIEFNSDGSVHVDPVLISTETRQTLNCNLKLYYIGNQRSASKILAEQNKNTAQADKFQALEHMVDLVYKLKEVLALGDLNALVTSSMKIGYLNRVWLRELPLHALIHFMIPQ